MFFCLRKLVQPHVVSLNSCIYSHLVSFHLHSVFCPRCNKTHYYKWWWQWLRYDCLLLNRFLKESHYFLLFFYYLKLVTVQCVYKCSLTLGTVSSLCIYVIYVHVHVYVPMRSALQMKPSFLWENNLQEVKWLLFKMCKMKIFGNWNQSDRKLVSRSYHWCINSWNVLIFTRSPSFVIDCQWVFFSVATTHRTPSSHSPGCLCSGHHLNPSTASLEFLNEITANNRPGWNTTWVQKRKHLFRLLWSGFIFLAVCHRPPWISNSCWVCFHLPPPQPLLRVFLLPHSLFFSSLPFDLFIFGLFFWSSSLPLTLPRLTTVQLLHLNI